MSCFRKKSITAMRQEETPLRKCLTAFDLTFMGIGAVIGAGIFVITGIVAATHTGPSIVLAYVIAAFACAFSALSYAELATAIGGCGGAYGYAYVGFGEIFAWILGWDLLLEYAISVSAVAVAWSAYLKDLLSTIDLHLPAALRHNPLQGGYLDVFATGIIMVLMILLLLGVKSSTRFNNLMVWIKLTIILMFIVIAMGNVHPANWTPFFPFGWTGLIQGTSLIFFAYVGFDAVATSAEEVIRPERDLPRGILGSLCICTVIYILVSGLLTGIVPYPELNTAAPISHALILIGHDLAAGLIGVGIMAGLTTVMLVLFYGLTRVFLAMARDGLLPEYFASIHPRTRTPKRIILLCGTLIALCAALLPLHDLAEMVNIGTLFAFIMVCLGTIVLHYTKPNMNRPFKTPGMPLFPTLGILSCSYLIFNLAWFTFLRFFIWLVIGLMIYFLFGYAHSKADEHKQGATH